MSSPVPIPASESTGRQTWTGRYNVRAVVSYRDRKGRSGLMQVITFQPFLSKLEALNLLESLDIHADMEGMMYYLSQVRDTFTMEQADLLVSYLNQRKGNQGVMRPANLPVPNLMGASAIPNLPSFRDRSIYKLYLEPGYCLEFKVSAINVKTYIAMAHLFREFKEQEMKEDQSFTSTS